MMPCHQESLLVWLCCQKALLVLDYRLLLWIAVIVYIKIMLLLITAEAVAVPEIFSVKCKHPAAGVVNLVIETGALTTHYIPHLVKHLVVCQKQRALWGGGACANLLINVAGPVPSSSSFLSFFFLFFFSTHVTNKWQQLGCQLSRQGATRPVIDFSSCNNQFSCFFLLLPVDGAGAPTATLAVKFS
jgi:hypothetical protein